MGIHFLLGPGQIGGNIFYGDKIAASRLLTRCKHVGLVPIPHGYNTYAVVVRTTSPELGDTTKVDLDPRLGVDLGAEKS